MSGTRQHLSLTLFAAMVGATCGAAFVAMRVLEDVSMSLVVAGLLLVTLLSFCRSSRDDVARRSRHEANR